MELGSGTLLVIVFFALACQLPTAARQVERLAFESINAPAVVPAPGPISLEIRRLHGACHHHFRIITTHRPGTIHLEALADYRLPPGAGGGIDIGVLKDTTLVLRDFSAGTLLTRGLQNKRDPAEVDVLVNALAAEKTQDWERL